MADVRITALPTAPSPITGDEIVPIVQNGQTVQTTVSAITQSPSLTQNFLTVGQEPQLPNSRYIGTGTGLGFTDGGAQGPYIIALNGTSASLEGASAGVVVKTAPNTIASRTLSTSGNGISVTNGDGVSGNPTFQLTGVAQALANATGSGLLAIGAGSTIAPVTIVGVSNEISVANGDGSAAPTIGIANNPILPGNAAVRIPSGTTAERSAGADGDFRYNSQTGSYEAFSGGVWRDLTLSGGVLSFSAGSTGFAPNSPTSGAITLSGILNSTSGGTGASALTGYMYGNGASPATASTTIPTTNLSGTISNAQLANSSLTVNGQSISLGSSGTITAVNPSALTIGTGLSGGTYDGSAPIVIALSNTGILGGTYGTESRTITQIVNPQGQITSIYDQPIDNIALTAGTISTSPSGSNDLVNKSYVDGLVATGLVYHSPVQAATTGTLASITGGTVTYNNGVSGVGATLTLSSPLTVLDGYTLANTNRILVKNEANQAHNGVYTWATGGTVLTRATDADTYGVTPDKLSQNDYFLVQNGLLNQGTSYVVTTVGTIIFGTTAITFVEFGSSKVYTAGTGLTLSGTQFSLTVPVVEVNGGTGQTSYTTGDLLVASGSTSLSKLADVATGNALISGGVGAAPAYGKIGLTTHVDGVLPIANGGTNATNAGDALTNLGAYPATNPSGYTTNTGTVTSVGGTGTVNGITLTGTVTSSGSLTLGGTLSGVSLSSQVTGTLPVANGGTGQTTYTDGQLLIGNSTGNTLTPATLTAGSGISITNGSGSITIASTSGGGSVTSVDVSGGTTGLTTSGGPVTSSGTITLAGTLNVANGGSGATTLTGYLKGNGTSAFTASSTIPNTDISGLGTMSTQNANSVAVTGGTIDGTTIGGSTAAAGSFTTLTTSSTVTHNAGTANGVAYLNASKVLTSGSALTFDGSQLEVSSLGTQLKLTRTSVGSGTLNIGGSGELAYASALHIFYDATKSSERMRITSAGEVGIGTSSPGTYGKFAIATSLGTGTEYQIVTTAGAAGAFTAKFKLGAYAPTGALGCDISSIMDYNSTTGTILTFGTVSGGQTSTTQPTERMRIDSSGNLGLGVTPSAWGTAYRGNIEGIGWSLSTPLSGGLNTLALSSNAYNSTGGTWNYRATANATKYEQFGGSHTWFTAPSGTAGNAISFSQVMTLHASGGLSIGNTTDPGATNLSVTGTISGGTVTGTVDGTNALGFRNIPQNSQSAAYTLVLADSGKHILHPSADTTARTFTIPANSSVAYPIGTAITFVNQNGAGVVTIAITTDTMRLAGAGTTGSRTLAANGVATAIKITSTEWIISGTGLT